MGKSTSENSYYQQSTFTQWPLNWNAAQGFNEVFWFMRLDAVALSNWMCVSRAMLSTHLSALQCVQLGR